MFLRGQMANKALKIGRCAPWDLNSFAISAPLVRRYENRAARGFMGAIAEQGGGKEIVPVFSVRLKAWEVIEDFGRFRP